MFTATENMNRVDSEFIFHIYKILPVILSLLGATLSFLFYSFGSGLLISYPILKYVTLVLRVAMTLADPYQFLEVIEEAQNLLAQPQRVPQVEAAAGAAQPQRVPEVEGVPQNEQLPEVEAAAGAAQPPRVPQDELLPGFEHVRQA